MARSSYSPISPSTELTSFPHGSDTVPLKQTAGSAIGKPRAKPFLDNIDLLAVLGSCTSLIASICVITPDWSLSWRLGFEGQIIVIGFLLSIMTLCMRRVAPTLFLILEARWGDSRLQNYEALLRVTITLSHTRLIWRVTLLSLILLPLGLSVAYKRFIGGLSTVSIDARYPGYYGLAPPPMGNYHVINNYSPYLAINASVPFLDASSSDDNPLPLWQLPKAYGFNTLLIDKTSTALLDVPVPDYVSSVQQNLTYQESWNLSASVNATVATYNDSFHVDQTNKTFWKQLLEEGLYLSSYRLFQPNNTSLGMIADRKIASSGEYSPYCLISYYSSNQDRSLQIFTNEKDGNSESFQKSSPMRFDIQRQTCAGTWEITKTSLQLIEGSCTQMPAPSRPVPNTFPFYLEVLPIMVNTIGEYSPHGHRYTSQWRMPAITTSIATVYWARSLYMNRDIPKGPKGYIQNPELYYPATNEALSSTNATLDAHWLLYFVLCLQPVLKISMFLLAMALYDTPVDKGFGLVAILSGIDKQSLEIMHGAALSGELRRPVNLNIDVLGDVGEDMTSRRLRYTIGGEGQGKPKLRRGMKYE